MSIDRFDHLMRQARVLLSERFDVPCLPPDLWLRTTSPPFDSRAREFCKAVGISPPVPLRVTPIEGAEPGWCIRNVKRYIDEHGGSIAYGWIVWGTPALFYEAEFHAVCLTCEGGLIDVTPQHDGELAILFSEAGVSADFDFVTERPGNKRKKVYRSPWLNEKVEEKLCSMNEASRRYAGERARKKGLSLRQWIETRIDGDPYDNAIDRLIALGDKMDAMLKPTSDGTMLRTGVTTAELSRITEDLLRAKLKLWTMAEGQLMCDMAGVVPGSTM